MFDLYSYNEEAYECMQEMFINNDRALIIKPPSTGKMLIFLKWAYSNKDRKILYLAPTNAILRQLKNKIEEYNLYLPNLEICTYSGLLNWNQEKLAGNYYGLCLDEAHEGKEAWNNQVDELIRLNKGVKVLGLTATPTRFTDHKSIIDTKFNGNVAYEMTLAEAIAKGILPFPNYILCTYSLIKEIEKRKILIDSTKDLIKKNKGNEILSEIKKQVLYELKDVIKDYIKENGKYLVFCKDINHLREIEEVFIKWFSKESIFSIHSDKSKTENEKILSEFEQEDNKIKILLSIDKLTLGYHPKNIRGIVMLRPTQSHIVFIQQLGRCFSYLEKPLVIDAVDNIESYENIYDIRDEVMRYLGYKDYNDSRLPKELKDKFEIKEISKDIVNLLKKIDIMFRKVVPFNEMVETIKEYLRITNKKYDDIIVTDTYKDYPIGNWIYSRNRDFFNGKLTEKEINDLKDIGATFKSYKIKKSFDEMIEIVKEYLNNNNLNYDSITEKTIYKNEAIGQWRYNQRKRFSLGILSQERIKKLQTLGEDFMPKQCSFDEIIEIIKECILNDKIIYNDITIRYVYKNIPIGRKIDYYRKLYFEGKLSKKNEKILRNLGEQFLNKKIAFEEMIDLINEYMNLYNISYNDIKYKTIYKNQHIGWWKDTQRKKYQKGKLTNEQELMLRKLGEVFPNINKTIKNPKLIKPRQKSI